MKKAFTLVEVLAGRGTMPTVFSKAGFTLAEVLITLGIIGIVAAMTIPNLIQKNYEHQTVTKLKKTHSIISQAMRLASEEYGDPSGWEIFGNTEASVIKEYITYNGWTGSFFIDTNGSKPPNAWGWDTFTFTIHNDGIVPEGCNKKFNYYKTTCANKNSAGNGCACYIHLNNNMNYLHTK